MQNLLRIEGLTNKGFKLHLFSPNLHRAGTLETDNNVSVHKSSNTSHSVIYARCTGEDIFFTVKQGSNDLEILDLNAKKRVASYKGYQEEPYSNRLISLPANYL